MKLALRYISWTSLFLVLQTVSSSFISVQFYTLLSDLEDGDFQGSHIMENHEKKGGIVKQFM